jgi:putative oxidoreductase
MNTNMLQSWAPRGLAALRIVTGLLFLQHPLMKFFGFPAPMPGVSHLPPLIQVAGGLELVGAPLIILGLFTRPVAFILCGEMAVAYWMAHAPRSFWPALNMGEGAILFCFIFLYLVFAGPGAWSVDGLRKSAPLAAA